jgi:8-oxo-dGTP pyrophosphatase MutT (NUDIX family)
MIYLEKPVTFFSRFSVVTCIFLWKGKTLLLYRRNESPQGSRWGLPGGKIEKGEEALAAMKREILEETGIDINETSLNLFRLFWVDTIGVQFEYYLYYASFAEKPKIVLSAEHITCKWVELHEVLSERLVADHPRCMKLFLKEMKLA